MTTTPNDSTEHPEIAETEAPADSSTDPEGLPEPDEESTGLAEG